MQCSDPPGWDPYLGEMAWGAGWDASTLPPSFRTDGYNVTLHRYTAWAAWATAGVYELRLLASTHVGARLVLELADGTALTLTKTSGSSSAGRTFVPTATDAAGNVIYHGLPMPTRIERISITFSVSPAAPAAESGSFRLLREYLPPSPAPPVPSVPPASPGAVAVPPASPGSSVQPPASPGMGSQPPASPGMGSQPPASPGMGSQPPASPGMGTQPPASPGMGSQPPASPGMGSQPPASPGMGSQPPASPGMGSQPPASPGLGSQPPASPSAGSQPPASPGMGSQPPASPVFGPQPPPPPPAIPPRPAAPSPSVPATPSPSAPASAPSAPAPPPAPSAPTPAGAIPPLPPSPTLGTYPPAPTPPRVAYPPFPGYGPAYPPAPAAYPPPAFGVYPSPPMPSPAQPPLSSFPSPAVSVPPPPATPSPTLPPSPAPRVPGDSLPPASPAPAAVAPATPPPMPAPTVNGTALHGEAYDGYLHGCTVYLDRDSNGAFDASEPNAGTVYISQGQGADFTSWLGWTLALPYNTSYDGLNVRLMAASGTLLAADRSVPIDAVGKPAGGCYDAATHLRLPVGLAAPAGHCSVLSPASTLLVHWAESLVNATLSYSAAVPVAKQQLADALGLTTTSGFCTADTYRDFIQDGAASAERLLRAELAIMGLVLGTCSFLAAGPTAQPACGPFAFAALAEQLRIRTADGAAVSLSDINLIAAVIDDAADAASADGRVPLNTASVTADPARVAAAAGAIVRALRLQERHSALLPLLRASMITQREVAAALATFGAAAATPAADAIAALEAATSDAALESYMDALPFLPGVVLPGYGIQQGAPERSPPPPGTLVLSRGSPDDKALWLGIAIGVPLGAGLIFGTLFLVARRRKQAQEARRQAYAVTVDDSTAAASAKAAAAADAAPAVNGNGNGAAAAAAPAAPPGPGNAFAGLSLVAAAVAAEDLETASPVPSPRFPAPRSSGSGRVSGSGRTSGRVHPEGGSDSGGAAQRLSPGASPRSHTSPGQAPPPSAAAAASPIRNGSAPGAAAAAAAASAPPRSEPLLGPAPPSGPGPCVAAIMPILWPPPPLALAAEANGSAAAEPPTAAAADGAASPRGEPVVGIELLASKESIAPSRNASASGGGAARSGSDINLNEFMRMPASRTGSAFSATAAAAAVASAAAAAAATPPSPRGEGPRGEAEVRPSITNVEEVELVAAAAPLMGL